jgi:hypothetical protein
MGMHRAGWTMQGACECMRLGRTNVLQVAYRADLPSASIGRPLRFPAAGLREWVPQQTQSNRCQDLERLEGRVSGIPRPWRFVGSIGQSMDRGHGGADDGVSHCMRGVGSCRR